MRKSLACAVLLFVSSTIAGERLNLSVEGPQFQVNAHPVGQIDGLCLAMDRDGEFVIVWTGPGQDGKSREIFGKRYHKDGPELSPPSGKRLADRGNVFQVNSYTAEDQTQPHVAMDARGNFVVVWQSQGQDGEHLGVFAKRYDSEGRELPPPPQQRGAGHGNEFQVNQEIREYQMNPSITMFDAGSFVIAWRGRVFARDQGGIRAILARRYDRAGIPSGEEFRVNTVSTNAHYVSLATAAVDGRFFFAWANDDRDEDVWAVQYDAQNRVVTPARAFGGDGSGQFKVNSYTGRHHLVAHGSAIDDTGRLLIAFGSSMQDGDGSGVFVKLYDPRGNEIGLDSTTPGSGVGNEFQVNSYTQSNQGVAAVATGPSGRFVLSWGSRGQDGDHYGIFAKAYDREGNEVEPVSDLRGEGVGNEFQVNSSVQGLQVLPQVAMDRDGDFIIAWRSSDAGGGVFARRYSLR